MSQDKRNTCVCHCTDAQVVDSTSHSHSQSQSHSTSSDSDSDSVSVSSFVCVSLVTSRHLYQLPLPLLLWKLYGSTEMKIKSSAPSGSQAGRQPVSQGSQLVPLQRVK